MKYLSVILILGCLGMLCIASAAYAATEMEERRDFPIQDPGAVFKRALDDIERNIFENDMFEGYIRSMFDKEKLAQGKYYIHTIHDEYFEPSNDLVLVMVDDGTSSDGYYNILYGMPTMWEIYFVMGIYSHPFDEYLDDLFVSYDINVYSSRFSWLYDDEDDTGDSVAASESDSGGSGNRHSILDTVNTK